MTLCPTNTPLRDTLKISLMDRSLYFKGMMLLIRKDRVVGEEERALMMRIGQLLSFEKGFCQGVIDDILTNEHVLDEPPLFSEPEVARCFIKDGLKVSLSDGQLHDSERHWLSDVAEANGLDRSWYDALAQESPAPAVAGPGSALEAESFVWD